MGKEKRLLKMDIFMKVKLIALKMLFRNFRNLKYCLISEMALSVL